MSLRLEDRQKFDVNAYNEHRKTDEKNLSGEMSDLADIIGFYSHQESLWDWTIKSIKNELEFLEAKIILELKDGTAKYTKDQADAFVTTHSDVVKLKKAIIEGEAHKKAYTGAVNALHEKSKMIQSLSVRERQEKILYGSPLGSGGYAGSAYGAEVTPAVLSGSPYVSTTSAVSNNEKVLKLLAERQKNAEKALALSKTFD